VEIVELYFPPGHAGAIGLKLLRVAALIKRGLSALAARHPA
jgi:hypothetical protein